MRTHIRFQFDPDKAVAAMSYILSRIGKSDKIKLIKLLYISDRECFVARGHPITGDHPYAMPKGPVPTHCLDLLNGNTFFQDSKIFRFLRVSDDKVELRDGITGVPQLDEHERAIVDAVVDAHGGTPTWTLVDQTHEYPEYRETYVEDTSTPIPFEIILKHHGSPGQYRHNRPVVSPEMAERMMSPFPRSEPDL